MDKTFDEAVAGIRKAERGVEVREDIAQGMEYVKQYAEEVTGQQQATLQAAKTATGAASTATKKAAAAAKSEAAANTAATSADQSAQAASENAGKAESSAASAKASADKATAIVSADKTLSVEGAPADAKATGDALNARYTKEEVDAFLQNVNPFPVGSIYQSTDPTSPAALFGGIWEEIAQERTLMGASSTHAAGSTVEAGLPNLTGNSGIGNWTVTSASGVFAAKGPSSKTAYVDNAYAGALDFDASRSNAIYGASSTVQPPAYFVHIWERMGYLLNIYAEVGSSLTITDGVTTVEDVMDASGRYSRELPNTGTWTVTAVKNGFTEAETFKVSSYGVFTADLAIRTFGVVWDYNASSTTLTRLTKATDPNGFVTTDITTEPVAAVGATGGRSPFDSYMPWSGMEEYNIVNSAVGVKRGDRGFSRANDTVVLIPEFYYKVVDDATNKKRYFYISDKAGSGFDKHPGSGRYVGKYNTGAGYVSKTGIAPLTSITRVAARTGSTGKGSGWYQYDMALHSAIQLLYLVEYADFDSQRKFGWGISGASGIYNSGETDTMTYHTGRAVDTGNIAVQYRHIENPYGNMECFVDGVNFNGNTVYICTDPTKYADDTSTGYTKAGTKAGSEGYIKALGFSTAMPWAFYPSEVGGSDATYIPDYLYADSSGWRTMAVQGPYSGGWKNGLYFYTVNKTSDVASNILGSRLMYIPQN